MTADRYVPDPERVDHRQCHDPKPHLDHYWRTDGKPFQDPEDPTTAFCLGVK